MGRVVPTVETVVPDPGVIPGLRDPTGGRLDTSGGTRPLRPEARELSTKGPVLARLDYRHLVEGRCRRTRDLRCTRDSRYLSVWGVCVGQPWMFPEAGRVVSDEDPRRKIHKLKRSF